MQETTLAGIDFFYILFCLIFKVSHVFIEVFFKHFVIIQENLDGIDIVGLIL